ncbi:MAG: CPBP family intramembrane metalloprotease [Flavobacteriales bacterium]|nr:CPBP family intramembrane metalloprotease [Flavobacteriales bacterium]
MNLKGIYKEKTEGQKLFFFVLIIFISSIVGFLSSAIITTDTEILRSDLTNPDNIFLIKLMQLITSVFIFIVPALLLSYFEGGNLFNNLDLRKKIKRQNVLLIILIMLFSQILVAVSMQWNLEIINSLKSFIPSVVESMKLMEENAKTITEAFLKMENTSDLLFNLFLIAFIPAIGEEMVFRGVLQKKLHSILQSHHLAIFVSSFIFSAIHMQFFGFLPRFILGIILGYLFYYSKNLWMPIIAHFINNALAVLLMYPAFANKLKALFQEPSHDWDVTDPVNQIMQNPDLFQVFFSVSVVLIFIYLFKKINSRE